MGDLQVDTAVEPVGDGRFRGVPSSDWEIWGPMGGYIASFALRAVGAVTPHARPATFACHYLGVARFEPIDIRVEARKEGRAASSHRVEITQDGRPILDASMWSTTGILMDEPTAALGTRQSDVVCELIRRTADRGLGVMVISHDLPRILAIADRIVVLRHGMVALTGSPSEITRRDVVDAMVGYHERAGS